ATEVVRVDRRSRVRIHATIKQPLRDLQLVEVSSDVKKRRPMHRRPLGVVPVLGAGGAEREDVGDVEGTREQIGIALEGWIEQVNAPAMERHYRRIGRLEAVLDVHLQDAVFRRWFPAVGPEQVLHRIPVNPLWPNHAGTEREQNGGAFYVQRVRGTGERRFV